MRFVLLSHFYQQSVLLLVLLKGWENKIIIKISNNLPRF